MLTSIKTFFSNLWRRLTGRNDPPPKTPQTSDSPGNPTKPT